MNHKQKLGYILLGAGVMAVGITIGQFITPQPEAQQNGYFDTILCRQLLVKNAGDDMSAVMLSPERVLITRGEKVAVELLASEKYGNVVRTYNPQTGKRAVTMYSMEEIAGVSIWDRRDEESFAVAMFSTDDRSELGVFNPQTRKKAVEMKSDEFANHLTVSDYKNSIGSAFHFSSPSFDDLGNIAIYYDRQKGEHVTLRDYERSSNSR